MAVCRLRRCARAGKTAGTTFKRNQNDALKKRRAVRANCIVRFCHRDMETVLIGVWWGSCHHIGSPPRPIACSGSKVTDAICSGGSRWDPKAEKSSDFLRMVGVCPHTTPKADWSEQGRGWRDEEEVEKGSLPQLHTVA